MRSQRGSRFSYLIPPSLDTISSLALPKKPRLSMNAPSLRLKAYFSNVGNHRHVFTAEIIINMIVVDIHAHSKKANLLPATRRFQSSLPRS